MRGHRQARADDVHNQNGGGLIVLEADRQLAGVAELLHIVRGGLGEVLHNEDAASQDRCPK